MQKITTEQKAKNIFSEYVEGRRTYKDVEKRLNKEGMTVKNLHRGNGKYVVNISSGKNIINLKF